MKKVQDIITCEDLIKRSKTIKSIFDVFDMLHEDMTRREVAQACLNLYALKLKENPQIINAFVKVLPVGAPEDMVKFYDKQLKVVRLHPIFFSEDEFNHAFDQQAVVDDTTSAMFMIAFDTIVISNKFFEDNYKENPFLILLAVYHELEHLAQKYEQDDELRAIYDKNRLSYLVVNEDTVKEVLKNNNNDIKNALKEFNSLPDEKKYNDLFGFVKISPKTSGSFYNYTTFDDCHDFYMPMVENLFSKEMADVIYNQLHLAQLNFYINSPMEQKAKLHEALFGMYMNMYAKLNKKNPFRQDWIVEQMQATTFDIYRASDFCDSEHHYEDMMNEQTANEKVNYIISQNKNDLQLKKDVRMAIIELFSAPLMKEFSKEKQDIFAKVGTYFFVACFENGMIDEPLSAKCVENFNKLMKTIKSGEYYKDKKIQSEIANFIKDKVICDDESLQEEIAKQF